MSNPTSQAVAVLGSAGFTPEQVQVLLSGRAVSAQSHSTSDDLLDEFASRAAGTGMTSDVAGWWADRLEQGFDGHPAAKELVAGTVARLRGGAPVSHGEGIGIATSFVQALSDIRKPSANVIETTARPVSEPEQAAATYGYGR